MTPKKLLRQVQAWNQQGKFRKVYNTLEGLPDRSPELDWNLAAACLQLASQSDPEERRRMAGRTRDLLLGLPETMQQESSWMLTYGSALLQLDRGDEALLWLEKASRLQPDSEEIREVLQQARNLAEDSGAEATYRARTVQVWQKFAEIEPRLRAIVKACKGPQMTPEESQAFHAILGDTFAPVLTAPQRCQFRFQNGKAGIEFLLSGTVFRLYQMRYFVDHAPAGIREHWKFSLGLHPMEEFIINEPDCHLNSRDVYVRIRSAHEDTVELDFHANVLLSMYRKAGRYTQRLTDILSLLSDATLGEISALDLNLGFRVVEARTEDFFPLRQLRSRLTDLGISLCDSPEALLADWSETYDDTDSNRVPTQGLRSDVTLGSSALPEMLANFRTGWNDVVDMWADTGILTGFFWFSRHGLDPDGGDDGSWKLLDELQKHLAQTAGPDAFQSIGWAMGDENVYLDVIAWDSLTLLREALFFFREHSVDQAAFQSFNATKDPFWLVGDPDGDEEEESGD